MKNPFKQKRCKQCGWELSIFTSQKFCGGNCAAVFDACEKEYEESLKRQRTGGVL